MTRVPNDAGARPLQQLCDGLDRSAGLGFNLQPPARVHQQADLQTPDLAAELLPGDGLRRQAGGIAPVRPAQHRHQGGAVGHGAGHRPGHPADKGRLDRHPAGAGLEADQAAPAGGQPHRAANVGADMQGPVATGTRRTGTGAAAARVFGGVPGVAGERVKTRQARGQHAVVGHRGLGQQHQPGLPPARGGRCILGHRPQVAGGGAYRHGAASGGDVFLQRAGHTIQRRERLVARPACFTGAGLDQRRIGVKGEQGLQLRLAAPDLVDHRLGHLHWRQAVAGKGLGERNGAEGVQVGHERGQGREGKW